MSAERLLCTLLVALALCTCMVVQPLMTLQPEQSLMTLQLEHKAAQMAPTLVSRLPWGSSQYPPLLSSLPTAPPLLSSPPPPLPSPPPPPPLPPPPLQPLSASPQPTLTDHCYVRLAGSCTWSRFNKPQYRSWFLVYRPTDTTAQQRMTACRKRADAWKLTCGGDDARAEHALRAEHAKPVEQPPDRNVPRYRKRLTSPSPHHEHAADAMNMTLMMPAVRVPPSDGSRIVSEAAGNAIRLSNLSASGVEDRDPSRLLPSASQRYLLYDVSAVEGLNKQRRACMFYLRRAMELGRVLVVPSIRLLAKHQHPVDDRSAAIWTGVEDVHIPWEALFNLSALRALHAVVELHDFLRSGRVPSRYANLGCNESGSQPDGSDEAGATVAPFNGCTVRVLEQVSCSRTRQLQHSLPRLYHDTSSSIAFANVVDILPPDLARDLRPYVRFNNGLYAAAAAFVRHQFGDAPWVAIHWRRGDFVGLRPDAYVHPASRLIAHVKRLAAARGVELASLAVYLATDAPEGSSELAKVQAALRVVRAGVDALGDERALADRLLGGNASHGRLCGMRPSVDDRAAQARQRRAVVAAQLANLEVAICSMAPWFLGSGTSSFTFTVLEERGTVFGHPASSGAEMAGEDADGWTLDLPASDVHSRWQPLQLSERPPELRVRPPKTVAEMRAMLQGRG